MESKIIQALVVLGVPGVALGVFYLLLRQFNFRFKTIDATWAAIITILFLIIVGGITFYAIHRWAPDNNQNQGAVLPINNQGNNQDSTSTNSSHGSNATFSRISIDIKNRYWEEIDRATPNHFDNFLENPSERKRVCPGLFFSEEWCPKCAKFFSQKGLQDEAIDPSFDVIIVNNGNTPETLLSIGVNIVHAFDNTYSLGDWTSTKVAIEANYSLRMPQGPAKVILYDEDGSNKRVIDIIKHRGEQEQEAGHTLQDMSISALLQTTYWEWAELPLRITKDIQDPIYMQPGAPYRFTLTLQEYKNMPNNVVIRFFIRTNRGDLDSGYVYLLAI